MKNLSTSPFSQSVLKIALFAAVAPSLLACSPERTATQDNARQPSIPTAPVTPHLAPPKASPPNSAKTAVAPNLLSLQGLGTLKLGEQIPAGSGWAERGAQIPGSCKTVSSPDFPGVYAIVEEGEVRRITVNGQSKVVLRDGIGTGTTEAEVRAAFPEFQSEPHKYVESPAKYLTAPSAANGEPALRFEINREGRVSFVHVGVMPVLGYVEGCA